MSAILSVLTALFLLPLAVAAETKPEPIVSATTAPVTRPAETIVYDVTVVTLKARPAIAMKAKANIAQLGLFIEGVFNRLEDYMKLKKIDPAGDPFTRTFKFQDGEIEFESGYPLKKKIVNEGEFIAVELPGGQAATTVHVNETKNSQKAYKAIENWMKKNNRVASGAPWEVYVSDKNVALHQAKLRIYYPLK